MAYEAWTVEVEYEAGVWTDITSRVDTASNPFTILNGDTPESSTDTGGVTLPLQNHDQAFTPGNTLSALALRPGLRVRVRETANGQTFDRALGYTAYPEIQAWTQSNATTPRDQLLILPVIDRAAWVAQGRKFIGTLAEHIVHEGGTTLKAYWPLREQALPVETVETDPWPLPNTQITRAAAGYYPNDPSVPSMTFAGATPISGDDTPGCDFQPSRDMTVPIVVETVELVGYRDTPLTLSSGQVCTLVAWVNPDAQLPAINSPVPVWLNYLDANEDPLSGVISAAIGISTGAWYGSAAHVDWSGTVNGPAVPSDMWFPIAIRLGFNPAVLELWVGTNVYTATMTVTTPNPGSMNHMRIGRSFDGSVAHVQVYIGAESDWDRTDFLAQHQMGLYGGDRQSTGERIRTVLRYAGVAPGELGAIDEGASLMQPMSLAGRGPIDVIADAVATEQGEFYADGAGQFVFADRIRLLNV